jgi:lipopolysaccharide transport system permease protein
MPQELIIEPGRADRQYWRDIWRYRELFYFLSWRDILVRYKQTVIGIAWAVVKPLLTTVVFSFVFGRIAKLPPDGSAPYSVMVFAAMMPWQFVATSLTECSNSLIGNANLISKIYFPRLIIPAGSVITSFVDFLISAGLLVLMMAWFRWWPDFRLLSIPLFIALAFAASAGPGLWLAALNVKYRDFRYVVPFLVQTGLYVSPVGFSSKIVPERWRLLYSLNPMVGVIDGFRWAILRGETPFYWPGVGLSLAVTFLLLVSGIWYFRRVERSFADVI